ncbi:MAG: M20 metallopeptidase family protein [Fusobacteriaceae bacterium]
MTISKNIINNLAIHRRELHQIPELGFQEFKTQKYLMEKLKEMGYEPFEICGTGVYVYIDNNKDNSYAFRSDMDALPIEENKHSFSSTHSGKMHACGHDGHMATLLGFASYLKTLDKYKFNSNILLIFQPAEEGPGGAKNIVETGIFDKYKIKSIFGFHLFPTLPQGTIGSKIGGLMAKAAEINIDIIGKSGHSGQPHKTIDSIQIALSFLQSMNTIVSKNLSPFDPSLISFNKIIGGTVRNIVAEKTRLEGTIRSFSEESFSLIIKKIKDIIHGLEISWNCKINMNIAEGYPPVINDKKYYDIFKRAMESSSSIKLVEVEPEMLAEDFSFYQEKIPGVFYFVGTLNKEKKFDNALHNCGFNFDEKALEYALESYILIFNSLNELD